MMKSSTLDQNLTLLNEQLRDMKEPKEENLKVLLDEYLSLKNEYNNRSLSKLIQISDYLILPIEELIKGDFQCEQIIVNLKTDNLIPKTYKDSQTHLSTFNGMRNVISYLEKVLDQSTLNWLFKKSSLQPRFFNDNEYFGSKGNYLSSHIPVSIFSHLSSYGFLTEHYIQMGSETAENFSFAIKKRIKSLGGPKEVFEVIIHEIIPIGYDRLINYEIINLSKSRCRLKLSPKPEAFNNFQGRPPLSEELYYYLIGAFKGSIDLTNNKVTKTVMLSSSQKAGAQFEIHWHKAIKRPVSLQPSH